MQTIVTQPSSEAAPTSSPKQPRDWFGYIFSAIVAIVITVAATWYQLYLTDKQATAAEVERSHAVRQSVISIIEEQALNGIRLEPERINRLIEQRRREQNITLTIPISDTVEQAEFNIQSSTYIGIDRKQQIKPVFDAFYAELAARTFQAFPQTTPNSAALNELAKQIQDGKTASALANLQKISDVYNLEVTQLTKKASPTIFEAIGSIFTQPWKLVLLLAAYAVLLFLAVVSRRRRKFREIRDRNGAF